jgi:hypothetical protein
VSILEPDHQAEPGPGLVDRADLLVDQLVGETELLHVAEGHIRLHTGGAFGPGNPETARRVERPSQRRQAALQVAPTGGEEDDHVEGTAGAGTDRDALGQRLQQAREVIRG